MLMQFSVKTPWKFSWFDFGKKIYAIYFGIEKNILYILGWKRWCIPKFTLLRVLLAVEAVWRPNHSKLIGGPNNTTKSHLGPKTKEEQTLEEIYSRTFTSTYHCEELKTMHQIQWQVHHFTIAWLPNHLQSRKLGKARKSHASKFSMHSNL
jgi:hypothetical protein